MTISPVFDFRSDWEKYRSGCLPLGWLLRHTGDPPWVRFHALPGWKRYADDDAERQSILFRANTLGDSLLGSGQPCWIIEARSTGDIGCGDLAMTAVESLDPHEPVWSFYVRRERWLAGAFDDKLLSIAEDEPGRAIWMRCDNGAIFAPYDGGFDLFPATWQEVAVLKQKQPDWLSSHPVGL